MLRLSVLELQGLHVTDGRTDRRTDRGQSVQCFLLVERPHNEETDGLAVASCRSETTARWQAACSASV